MALKKYKISKILMLISVLCMSLNITYCNNESIKSKLLALFNNKYQNTIEKDDINIKLENKFKKIKYSISINHANDLCGELSKNLIANMLEKTGAFGVSDSMSSKYLINIECNLENNSKNINLTKNNIKALSGYLKNIKVEIIHRVSGMNKTYFARGFRYENMISQMSDNIYKNITGLDGYFNDPILYINKTSSLGGEVSILQNEINTPKKITYGNGYVFSPYIRNQHVVYSMFSKNISSPSRVYYYNIIDGKIILISDPMRSAFSPTISNNQKKISYSMSHGMNTEIYEYDIQDKKAIRITSIKGITTSPSYSPDDKKMVIASDFQGSQQLYILDIDNINNKLQQISLGKGNYSAPSWSPNGKFISFIKMQDKLFHLGILDVTNNFKEHILLTKKYIDSPSWSKGSNALIFEYDQYSRGSVKTGNIGIFDLLGNQFFNVNIKNGAKNPIWITLNNHQQDNQESS